MRDRRLWAGIPDGDDLSSYMTGYYKLLAMGLVTANEGFTAWVEPYAFSTGGGMGTTVSAPVYDRGHRPCLLEWRASISPSTSCKRSPGQLRDGVGRFGHAVDGAVPRFHD